MGFVGDVLCCCAQLSVGIDALIDQDLLLLSTQLLSI